MIPKIAIQRFYKMVNKTPNCWIWIGSPSSKRYGNQVIKRKTYLSHRLSWMIHRGKIPKGMYILHKCDVMRCVNPKHLFLGTARDNLLDSIKKGRRNDKGEGNPRAKLTEQQVKEIREKYVPVRYGLEKLGREYNLSFGAIWSIVKKRNWKHI